MAATIGVGVGGVGSVRGCGCGCGDSDGEVAEDDDSITMVAEGRASLRMPVADPEKCRRQLAARRHVVIVRPCCAVCCVAGADAK